jgi:hypothetical protein
MPSRDCPEFCQSISTPACFAACPSVSFMGVSVRYILANRNWYTVL